MQNLRINCTKHARLAVCLFQLFYSDRPLNYFLSFFFYLRTVTLPDCLSPTMALFSLLTIIVVVVVVVVVVVCQLCDYFLAIQRNEFNWFQRKALYVRAV